MAAPKPGPLGKDKWVGSSKGKTPNIEAATLDGYNLARKLHPKGELQLKVIAVYAIGENPITEYRVALGLVT